MRVSTGSDVVTATVSLLPSPSIWAETSSMVTGPIARGITESRVRVDSMEVGLSASPQPGDALGRADDVGDPYAKFIVDHHRLAAGDQAIVDEHIEGLARHLVQLHHRARAEVEQILDGHPRPPELDGEIEGNVHQELEAACGRVVGTGGLLFHRASSPRCWAGSRSGRWRYGEGAARPGRSGR